MASSVSKLSYQRLRNEEEIIREREVKKAKAWLKFKALAGRRRRRLRIRGLRRWFPRKRTKLLSRFTVSWRKTLKRLKNGQSHMNDLFGGNFLVMQTNPTPFRCREKAYYMGNGLHGLSTSYSVGRIA